jgi:transposase
MAAQSLPPPALPSPLLAGNARFLPIEMAAAPTSRASPRPPALPVGVASPCATTQPEPAMHIELNRGPVSLTVRWPVSAGGDCAAWLRELTSGLLK